MIFGEMDDDGFFMGEINGQRGLVPSNFLQEAPLSDEDMNEGASIISPTRSGGSLSNLSDQRQSDLGTDKVCVINCMHAQHWSSFAVFNLSKILPSLLFKIC